jgi:hypothetical protein
LPQIFQNKDFHSDFCEQNHQEQQAVVSPG